MFKTNHDGIQSQHFFFIILFYLIIYICQQTNQRDLQEEIDVKVAATTLAIFSVCGGNTIKFQGDEAFSIMLLNTPKS